MGKCILAGHPPVGSVGFGTYTGDGAASQFISLGLTPKWVLVSYKGDIGSIITSEYACMALAGYPAIVSENTCVEIVDGGFNVRGGSSRPNTSGHLYYYIYGT